ncbi:MAG TPA: energy transducer TonB [Drouetiella sp.]
MFSKNVFSIKTFASVVSLSITLCTAFSAAAEAKILQGSASKDDEIMRLNRPDNSQSGGTSASDGLRLGRPMTAPDFHKTLSGLVDTRSFSPLSGRATRDDGKLGLLKPAQFGDIPNSKFDLGAERGSRELTLAWEAWHKQLSAAIYKTWSDIASVPGKATLRIYVTKDRQITGTLVQSSGNFEFDQGLLSAVRSLNGNPGLTFPSQSERQSVSFEADYVAATDIQPGFSWVKNDYEHIQKNY